MKLMRLAAAVVAANILATLALYSKLPAQVPVHWGLHGPDRYGSPLELALLGPGVLVLLLLIGLFLRRADPLAKPIDAGAPAAEAGAWEALILSLIALFALAHVMLMGQLAGYFHFGPRVARLFFPALLLVCGNFLPRVRPSYFMGIRTPWTLASEAVWRRTHRFAGKLLFFCGLACVCLLWLPEQAYLWCWLSLTLIGFLVPVAMSFVWWRAEQGA